MSAKCRLLLAEMDRAVGPHNVYNIYDNCAGYGPNRQAANLTDGDNDAEGSDRAGLAQWLEASGKDMRWLRKFLRDNLSNLPAAYAELDALGGAPENGGGGYDWTCGQFEAIPKYFKRPEVRAALHLPAVNGATFDYKTSGPASVVLYPDLIKKIRVLIYYGDADTCVPYIGNQEWTTSMETTGVVTEVRVRACALRVGTERARGHREAAGPLGTLWRWSRGGCPTHTRTLTRTAYGWLIAHSRALLQVAPWHPWYVSRDSAPSGYATSYSNDFTFITIKLAGHQVPKNVPATALEFFTRFVDNTPF